MILKVADGLIHKHIQLCSRNCAVELQLCVDEIQAQQNAGHPGKFGDSLPIGSFYSYHAAISEFCRNVNRSSVCFGSIAAVQVRLDISI
jgi:hypothetical protein